MDKELKIQHPYFIAIILMIASFIGLFSETALNMAMTDIMVDFSISASTAQWLTTGYLLLIGILVPISALLMKWFTTKQLLISALTFALIGAITAAFSPTFTFLLVGRLVQAVGTGILLPLSMSVILLVFPIEKRGLMMGLMGMVITAAPAFGPTVAGLIIEVSNWTYIFWISSLLYIILLLASYSRIENVSEITKPKIDTVSILLSSVGFGSIIYALSMLAEVNLLNVKVWTIMVVGIISLIIFYFRQKKIVTPIVNLNVFKFKAFTNGTILSFLGMLIILSTAILFPIYLKGALLVSALSAGLIMLPGNIFEIVITPVVGAFFNKIGARKFLLFGFLLTLIGNLIIILSTQSSADYWQVTIACIFIFSGAAMIVMPAQTHGLNQLSRDLYNDGSAVMNTLNQIAGAIGTTVAIALYTLGSQAETGKLTNISESIAISAGVRFTFYFISIVSVIGIIVTFFGTKEELN